MTEANAKAEAAAKEQAEIEAKARAESVAKAKAETEEKAAKELKAALEADPEELTEQSAASQPELQKTQEDVNERSVQCTQLQRALDEKTKALEDSRGACAE